MSERRPSYDLASNQAVVSGETRTVDERQERSGRLGKAVALLGVAGTSASLGLLAACNNEGEAETVSSNVKQSEESVVVQYIDRDLSEQHVVGFGAIVNGSFAEQVIEREGLFGIDLPSLANSVTLDNVGVTASFCYDGGVEHIKETTYVEENRRHYDVTIDPSDVRVCAKKNPSVTPHPTPSSSFVEDINHASNDLNRSLQDTWFEPLVNMDDIAKENQLWANLEQMAENAAIIKVIDECGAEVLVETEDDIELLIEEDIIRSENETASVNLDIRKGEIIELSKQSDVQDAIDKKVAEGWNITPGAAECEIPKSVLEGKDA
ncbi:MAG TPA: hypothetical protein VFM68_00485 [Candidatus Saccharimonadales bacterium]|nr:hypothetical protein [Candidatus Saccharimonadales bacterium]